MGVVLNLEDGKREVASIADLIALTGQDMGRVNELILSKAGSDVEMIPQIANHLISSGGKRLRPMVTLAAAALATPALAQPKEIRLDYATYNPVSLVLKERGTLEKALEAEGIKVRWVLSAGPVKTRSTAPIEAITVSPAC